MLNKLLTILNNVGFLQKEHLRIYITSRSIACDLYLSLYVISKNIFILFICLMTNYNFRGFWKLLKVEGIPC